MQVRVGERLHRSSDAVRLPRLPTSSDGAAEQWHFWSPRWFHPRHSAIPLRCRPTAPHSNFSHLKTFKFCYYLVTLLILLSNYFRTLSMRSFQLAQDKTNCEFTKRAITLSYRKIEWCIKIWYFHPKDTVLFNFSWIYICIAFKGSWISCLKNAYYWSLKS